MAHVAGTLSLTNSTVSLNLSAEGTGPTEVPPRGGGLFTSTGTVRLHHATVVSNRVAAASSSDGGGLASVTDTIEIRNTIIAANLASFDVAIDGSVFFDSSGFNRLARRIAYAEA